MAYGLRITLERLAASEQCERKYENGGSAGSGGSGMSNKLRAIGIMLVMAAAQFPVLAQQDASFTTTDGRTVALSSLRGKVVVLVFSSIQDPQCRSEFKALASLAERYRGREVGIFWVSINPVAAANDDRLRSPCGPPPGSVTVLRDGNQAAFKRFSGANAELPTVVVLDKQGQMHGHPRGGFNPNSDFVNDLGVIMDNLLKS
jgi:thiol-disulfide isomerase/thioredoxin